MARLALPFLVSVIRWLLCLPILYGGKLLVYVFAPVISLPPFIRYAEESAVTGYPSLLPGVKREFLIKPLMWAQTHDAPLDEYGVESYHRRDNTWLHKLALRLGIERYYYRVMWLWRNSAYGLAHDILGCDQTSAELIAFRDNGTWRRPVSDYQYWVMRNALGQVFWQLQGQIIYSKTRKIEYRLGWGVFRYSPHDKGMYHARVLPFRRY